MRAGAYIPILMIAGRTRWEIETWRLPRWWCGMPALAGWAGTMLAEVWSRDES